jgi:hypothetical protein
MGFVYDRLMCRIESLAVGAIQKVFGRDPFARHLGGGIPVSGLASGAHGGTIKRVRSPTVTLYRPEPDCANGRSPQPAGWIVPR